MQRLQETLDAGLDLESVEQTSRPAQITPEILPSPPPQSAHGTVVRGLTQQTVRREWELEEWHVPAACHLPLATSNKTESESGLR